MQYIFIKMVKEKMFVNPWEVKGDIDYNRLIKEFGLQKIDDKLLERIKKLGKSFF